MGSGASAALSASSQDEVNGLIADLSENARRKLVEAFGAGSAEGTASSLTEHKALLTDEQLETLKAAFKVIDADGSNKLSKKELQNLLVYIGMSPWLRTAVLNDMDIDKDSQVNLSEWLMLCPDEVKVKLFEKCTKDGVMEGYLKDDPAMKQKEEQPALDEDQRKAFAAALVVIDTDGSTTLSKLELRDLLKYLGMSPWLAAAVLRDMDADGDGEVSLAEWMHNCPDEVKHRLLPKITADGCLKDFMAKNAK